MWNRADQLYDPLPGPSVDLPTARSVDLARTRVEVSRRATVEDDQGWMNVVVERVADMPSERQ